MLTGNLFCRSIHIVFITWTTGALHGPPFAGLKLSTSARIELVTIDAKAGPPSLPSSSTSVILRVAMVSTLGLCILGHRFAPDRGGSFFTVGMKPQVRLLSERK